MDTRKFDKQIDDLNAKHYEAQKRLWKAKPDTKQYNSICAQMDSITARIAQVQATKNRAVAADYDQSCKAAREARFRDISRADSFRGKHLLDSPTDQ